MLSNSLKKQLDEFLKLLPGTNMTSVSDISQQMEIPSEEAESLCQILKDKGLVEVVGKPDFIQLTRNGRNFRLDSSFYVKTSQNTMNGRFNIYLGYFNQYFNKTILNTGEEQVNKIVEAFHKGLESTFIDGYKYKLESLEVFKIFKSERPEDYDDYLSLQSKKERAIFNNDGELVLYPEDLSNFGDEVTNNFVKHDFGNFTEAAEIKNKFTLDIFISHSHSDSEIAKKLADLMAKAFVIPNNRIRCTSAAGYKFRGGTRTLETIRNEVQTSKLLLVLITDYSVKSDYVVFEMGARWGIDLPLIPLFYNEKGSALLPKPLSNIIGLTVSNSSDMHQLIDDISEVINISQQPPTVYNQNIEEIVDLARSK